LFSLGIFTLIAQAPTPPPSDPSQGGNGPIGGNNPTGAPIDGGLGILLVLGAGYAARRIFDARKGSEE
jgi:hypothetical protein